MTYQPLVYREQGGSRLVIASGGELDLESGSTFTRAGVLQAATVVAAAEATNVVNVAIQLNDANGTALASRATVYAYLSDDANGDSIAGTAPDGGVAIGTDGVLDAVTAGKSFFLSSEADGDIDINITETGADVWYLVVVLPDGSHSVSNAITFT